MNKALIALLAGLAAGMLLAPDKGSVTRKKLTDGFNDFSEKLSDLAEKFTPESHKNNTSTTVPKMSDAV